MVSKQWPELHVNPKRPKDIDNLVNRLQGAINFLKSCALTKPTTSIFRPLIEIPAKQYAEIVGSDDALALLDETESVCGEIEHLSTEHENKTGNYEGLLPWRKLEIPVEELTSLESACCITGILPYQHFDEVAENLAETEAVIEKIDTAGNMHCCVVVCMKDFASDVSKILRSGDFEMVSFEGVSGTVSELIEECKAKLHEIEESLLKARQKASELSENLLSLQILFDHYQNLLGREQTRASAPATEHAVLLEGWVKIKDYGKAEQIVSKFAASSIGEIDIAEGEEIPVEIDNAGSVRPFEVITRLYGMPAETDVDPTVFLAPFFAIFFGLCMTDAAYGLIMAGILWWAIKKMQGDKGALWMMFTCSVMTVIAGALTGGWFGDAAQSLVPEKYVWVNEFREKIMLFDPMKNPMPFFKLSLGLGYLQIFVGLLIAFFNNIKRKEYVAAVCDQLSWLIFLNSLVLYAFCKEGSPGLSRLFGFIALSQVFVIFLFTERKSGLAGRIGGGTFALFSTVFYLGDVLSYVRLMALGMVTAGLGIAVNILVKLVMEVPYIGFILGAVLFVVGHMFNLAMSTLGSFVHSLRLQFVEFFPKFLVGGGRDFKPMKKQYKHVMIKRK